MLIQNINSAVSTPGYASDSGPVGASVHPAPSAHIEVPSIASAKQAAAQPTEAQLKVAVDSINQAMKDNNSNIQFSIDPNSKQTVIKVVDTQTGQLISQFPSKEAMAISQTIGQSQLGILVKQKV
jgi:flagellar protein FlaG